jgi:hypothetical protein
VPALALADTDAVFAQFAANLARGSVAECVIALRLLSVVCITLGEEHALHVWLRPLRTIIQRRQVNREEYAHNEEFQSYLEFSFKHVNQLFVYMRVSFRTCRVCTHLRPSYF